MKFSFMISLVGWVILFVAVAVLYFVLSKLGVFHAIEPTVGGVTSSKDSPRLRRRRPAGSPPPGSSATRCWSARSTWS